MARTDYEYQSTKPLNMAKKTTLRIALDRPCSEAWEGMTPTAPNRRYCDSCTKEVIDFTKLSDRQLVDFFRNNTKPVCGNYRKDQLNQDLEMIHYDRSSWRRVAAIVVALSLLGGQAMAQSSKPAAKTAVTISKNETSPTPSNTPRIISGFVSDAETGELLIGATVGVKMGSYGTATGIDGYFELEIAAKHTELVVSYLGYTAQSINLEKSPVHLEVALLPGVNLNQVVVRHFLPPRVSRDYTGGGRVYLVEKNTTTPPEKERILYLQSADVYPNPSVLPPTIRIHSPGNHKLQIQLFNALGQLVWRDQRKVIAGTNQLKISPDWAHWPSGTYFLSLEDESDQKKMLPLVKP